MNRFVNWLEFVGDAAAAKLLNAKVRTVRSWRTGTRRPNRDRVPEIMRVTGLKRDEIERVGGK